MLLNTVAITQQIQELAGVDPLADYDESFFQPSGFDHFAQFYLNTLPDELAELEPEDQLQFLVSELSENLGLALQVDSERPFATYRQISDRGVTQLQAVFDFSDPLLTFVHLFGQAKSLALLANNLGTTSLLKPTKLDRASLLEARHQLGALQEVQLSFEQSPKIFNPTQGLSAKFKGPNCTPLLESLLASQAEMVAVEYLEGSGIGMPESKIRFLKNGSMSANGVKLQFFLDLAQRVGTQLGQRYQRLMEDHQVSQQTEGGWTRLTGSPVRLKFQSPLPQVERLVQVLCHGQKSMDWFGHHCRLSPTLWQVNLFDTKGAKIRLELEKLHLNIYISSCRSLALFDRLESFLESQVSAQLEQISGEF